MEMRQLGGPLYERVVAQLCTEVKTQVREEGLMDEQTCPFCNQPMKAQEQTISVDGQLAHAECSAKAGGESIYIPGA